MGIKAIVSITIIPIEVYINIESIMKNIIYNIMVITFIIGFITVVGTLIGLIWGADPSILGKIFLTAFVLIGASGISLVIMND